MKKYAILWSILAIAPFFAALQAQGFAEQTCNFGFAFEISNNPSWGYGEAVVTSVQPHTPAAQAGIKTGDIIMEINGTATYLRDYQTIANWLFDSFSPQVTFTVRKPGAFYKQYKLNRICNEVSSLSEDDLATTFSMYSIEDSQTRSFTLPLQISTNNNADYSDYQSFNFIIDPNAPAVEKEIMTQVEKLLQEKGMVKNVYDPDMLIHTYYSYQPNNKYNAARRTGTNLKTWRFDTKSGEMKYLPILSGANANAASEGQYQLEFGLRFFDRKYIDPANPAQIWEGHVIEYLSDKMAMRDYLQMHLPLILMAFPSAPNSTTVEYIAAFKKYNYTGVHISSKDMKRITNVDKDSPAEKAGLKRDDIIQYIDNYKFDSTPAELLNAYKRFMVETMKYRDTRTRFVDANGYPDCMYWHESQYSSVQQAFNTSYYLTYFSYLFNFRKYIPHGGKYSGKIGFTVKSAKGAERTVYVTPEVKSAVTISLRR